MTALKNIKTLWHNCLDAKLYSVPDFKTQAFIISSLIQVCSRIFVSNHTAKQLKDTPEGPFRYKEAAKTFFRELGGFCLSYGVLRVSTILLRKSIMWALYVSDDKRNLLSKLGSGLLAPFEKMKTRNTSVISTGWQSIEQIGQKILGRPLKPVSQSDVADLLKAAGNEANLKRPLNMKVYNRLKLPIELVAKSMEAINFFHPKTIDISGQNQKALQFVKWAPILISCIPTVYLSGFWLERTSQMHAESIAQRIARYLQGTGTNPPSPPNAAFLNPAALPPTNPKAIIGPCPLPQRPLDTGYYASRNTVHPTFRSTYSSPWH